MLASLEAVIEWTSQWFYNPECLRRGWGYQRESRDRKWSRIGKTWLPDHIKKGKRGGVKLSGFLAEWFRPVGDRLNLWKRFCLLWHQEVGRELDCGCTYRWGVCRQADAFPHPFRSKLQCKRALCQKSGRRQNCQGCREDKEGRNEQLHLCGRRDSAGGRRVKGRWCKGVDAEVGRAQSRERQLARELSWRGRSDRATVREACGVEAERSDDN